MRFRGCGNRRNNVAIVTMQRYNINILAKHEKSCDAKLSGPVKWQPATTTDDIIGKTMVSFCFYEIMNLDDNMCLCEMVLFIYKINYWARIFDGIN